MPLPLPELPEVMEAQLWFELADQVQPAGAVTVKLPVPPPEPKLLLGGLIE